MGADLGTRLQKALDVVVVGQADTDLAGQQALNQGHIGSVGLGFQGLHGHQPLTGGIFALNFTHGGDEVMEAGVGGGPTDPAFEFGVLG